MKDLSGTGEYIADAIKHGNISFIAWYHDGRLLTANPRFYELTGYSPDETDAMRWPGDFASEELSMCIARGMEHSDLEVRSCQCDGNIVRKDRSQVPVSVFLHQHRNLDTGELRCYAFITDITRLKEREKQLQLAQYAIDHFMDSSLWLDKEGRIVYVNETACKSLGYTREELLSLRIWEIDNAYEWDVFARSFDNIKNARHMELESTGIAKDGRRFPVEVHASYIQYLGTELVVCFVRDITRRKQAEEALAESEEKFRVLADTSFAAILMIQENRFIYANPAAQDILGYTTDELSRMEFWFPVHPEYREEMKNYRIALLKGKTIPGRFEIKFLKKNGVMGWADIAVAPIRYRGRPAGVITAMEITERKQAELSLAESEEKFRVLSELSPTAIFLYQGDKLIYANPTAVAFTGFSAGEMVGKNFWDMVHPEYREMVRTYGLARQRGEPVPIRYEVKYITRYGEERWAEFTAGRIEYRGRPGGIVTAIDTTERKHTEIALREAKAQAELYVDLMGHDINNMNQAALGFLELAFEKVRTKGSLGGEDLDLLASAMGSLRNSSGLIDSVRKLQRERKGGLKPYVMDIRPLLAEVKEQYTSAPGREIAIKYTALCPCKVLANELLRDVFANIVGNAIKHSRGRIAINVSLSVERRNGKDFCRVDVEDTGPGISDDRKKAIFERAGMDRTKLTGKGLGLYLVKTLVDDFNGRVWVEDRVPGDYRKGARFVVLLPAAAGQGEGAASGVDVGNI